MKKLYLIILPLFILLTGCQKSFLDKESYSTLKGDYVLNTQAGMELLLNGAYDAVQSSSYYGGTLYLYEASKGPDFFVRNVSGGYSFYVENRYAESSSLNSNAKNIWSEIYSVVRNTTVLLDTIDNVVGDIESLRRIKGEAYALRGLAYFDLSRLFAYPPKFSCTTGSSYDTLFKWGVPIIDNIDMGFNILDYEVRRATADETWAYIIEQFEKSYSLLEGKVVEKGHVGPSAVLALLMRAYLYMENYSKVVSYGEEWLANYEANYSMISYDSYPSQYFKSFNSESIWEIKYSEDDNLSSNAINYWVRHPTNDIPGSEVDGTVSKNIGYGKLGLTYGNAVNGLEFMQTYKDDVRQYLICDLGILGKNYHTIRKYIGDPYHFVHNVPVVRLPEIYLTLSEAYYQVGNVTSATEYLTRVSMSRRKGTTSISSITTILNERRREFILEGHTYWDYFRNGRNITNRPIIESISSGSTITFGSVSGMSYRTVYPIPLSEMNANPAIRNQQNPGYAAWQFGVEEEN